jgi:hypothetical protein
LLDAYFPLDLIGPPCLNIGWAEFFVIFGETGTDAAIHYASCFYKLANAEL